MAGRESSESVSQPVADERLHELQQVLKAVPTGIIRIDASGQIVYANERAETQLGMRSSEATARTYNDAAWELRQPDGAPISDDELPFARVMATGDPVDGYRHRLTRPDGSDRVIEVSGVPIVTDTGTIESAVFALQDVTEQYERERELERYQEFITQSPDLIVIADEAGIIRYQSPTPQSATDFQYPDLVGESGFEYVHPDDRERTRAKFEQLLAAGSSSIVTAEYRIRQSNGEYRWFEARAINYLDTEPVDGVLLTIRDIHERKETETRLAHYERTIRTLQETTQQLLEATDRETVAKITLDGIESVFNFSTSGIWLANDERTQLDPVAMSDYAHEVIDRQPVYTAEGDSLSWTVYEAGSARRIDDMTDHPGRINEDTPIRSELIIPIGEFGVINIGATERAAFTDDDLRSVQLWSNTVESALARLDQIEQLQGREAELTRERDRLDDFASIIAHDLRNLVNVADGHLGVARSHEDFDRLAPVERALDRMDDIMDDTLTLARQGETIDDAEAVEVGQLVADCLDVIDAADATVTVADEFAVVADGDRLAHVFENLLRNSVEHGSTSSRPQADDAVDHGGPDVAVTVGRTDDGFYVEDDGPGIPPEDRETVFESGYTTREEGTGLGLRIVDQVVAAHGWEITVGEGTAGGARFEITGVEFADDGDAADTDESSLIR